jgi:hypothetical protein
MAKGLPAKDILPAFCCQEPYEDGSHYNRSSKPQSGAALPAGSLTFNPDGAAEALFLNRPPRPVKPDDEQFA